MPWYVCTWLYGTWLYAKMILCHHIRIPERSTSCVVCRITSTLSSILVSMYIIVRNMIVWLYGTWLYVRWFCVMIYVYIWEIDCVYGLPAPRCHVSGYGGDVMWTCIIACNHIHRWRDLTICACLVGYSYV